MLAALTNCSLLVASCLLLSCSIPNLEPTECIQARDIVREFYSFHFGNDMTYSIENLQKRRAFLTPRLFESLQSSAPPVDPFTLTDDQPKAFRVGECKVNEPGKRVVFEILLFWKTDTRTEQRPIHVGVENVDGRWLVDTID